MKDKKEYTTYSDFIKDEDFIKWKFSKEEHLEDFWNSFIEANPMLQELFDEACHYSDRFGLYKEHLPEADSSLLLETIKKDLIKYRKRRRVFTIARYASVACIIFVFGFIFFQRNINLEEPTVVANIEAQELLAEDIYLITPAGTIPFKNDIEAQIQEDNTLQIQTIGGQQTEKYLIDKSSNNQLIVPYGKRSQIQLSDGTKIWINSGSTLEFPSSFEGSERRIKISGEIYVDVAKDKKPFIVETKNFETKVYGTKFNISAYPEYTHTVVLEEGSIGVTPKKGREVILEPRDLLTLNLNNQIYKTSNIDTDLFSSWKNGYLVFDNASILQVLEQVGRYYNLSFNYDNYQELKERRCSGKIFLSNDLDNVLTTLALLASAEYKRDEKNNISINIFKP